MLHFLHMTTSCRTTRRRQQTTFHIKVIEIYTDLYSELLNRAKYILKK